MIVSPNESTLRRASLLWGCRAARCPPFEAPGDALRHAEAALIAAGLVRTGEAYVLAVGRGPSRESAARIHVRVAGE